ncbi:unnamed protein product [Camellia sinensis]
MDQDVDLSAKVVQWLQKSPHDEIYKPAAQSQYVECVYIGGNKIAIIGITMQGTN